MLNIESIVNEAEKNALIGKSKLPESILAYPGFTNPPTKHFFNNIGSNFTNYLEVGLHKASTFISTLYGNNCNGVGVDNWSQFQEDGIAKKMAYESCEKFIPGQYKLIEKDCWGVNNEDVDFGMIDLFFFDGEHSYDSQKKAITYFVPKLKKGCLVMIDDGSWPDVKNGTYDGIKEIEAVIDFEKFVWDGQQEGLFWNGLLLFTFK